MDRLANRRKEIMKDIIIQLHRGLPADEAKERFEKEVGTITSLEIAEIEQALINDGLQPEEIKKFCNVHALLFKSALDKSASAETFPSHPVYLFKLENREVEKLSKQIRAAIKVRHEPEFGGFDRFKSSLRDLLLKLKGVERHYQRKEQLLFPYLEKKGFIGPSKVMWGKDNEVRELFRAGIAGLDSLKSDGEFEAYSEKSLAPLLDEVEGMVFKEENILFPTAIEKLSPEDWVGILSESDAVGYVFIAQPHESDEMIREFKTALQEEPVFANGALSLPTGTLDLRELTALINGLPVDLTYVDADDTVKFFSMGKERIFSRTRSIIGRKVQNCHPPQSLDKVERILSSFKAGRTEPYDFWIDFKGKFVYIRYLPLRDSVGHYLGTLEVTQDISGIRNLRGERRLADEGG